MAPDTKSSDPPGWLSLPSVAAAVLGLALLRLYIAAHSGLAFDEGYYTFWSERLATGYLDHPPMVAAMIAAGRWLFGNNELGVRALAVLAGVLTSAAIWRIGALLLDRRAAALAVLFFNLTPAAGLGFVTTPDPPSILFWAATLWSLAEFMASGRAGWWLVAGVMAGLGLWSKYTGAFLAPGLLLLVLTSRERRGWLRLWQLWAGGALALLVFSPVIWWNAQRNWISFTFQGRRTLSDGVAPGFFDNLGDFLAGQALLMGPVLVGLAAAGLVLWLRRPAAPGRRGLALPVLTSLPALVYFLLHTLHDRVEANWLLPLWPALSLVAAATLLALFGRRPRLAGLLGGLQLALGAALVLFIYVQALFQPFALGALDRTAETRGWPALQRHVEELARDNGAHWIATGSNYGATGELASYFLFAGAPQPVRQVDEAVRWAFLPPFDPDAAGWPALYVRLEPNPDNPQPPTSLFGQARLLGVFHRAGAADGQLDTWSAFLVSEPTPALYAGLKP
jgi:4-amino-4-deoxy-L-arabinose transferase-like glycosyltransferase